MFIRPGGAHCVRGRTIASDLSGGNNKGQSQRSARNGQQTPPIFGARCGVYCNVHRKWSNIQAILTALGERQLATWAMRSSEAVIRSVRARTYTETDGDAADRSSNPVRSIHRRDNTGTQAIATMKLCQNACRRPNNVSHACTHTSSHTRGGGMNQA